MLDAENEEVVCLELREKFLKFVLPSIASMWAFSLYTMVDGVFVARGVGETAMAAVNLSAPFTSLVFMVGILLATGTSTIISIALGRGELEEARNSFSQNLAVTVCVSLALTALVLLNLERAALFLGATPDTLAYVKEYVGTIAVFAVFFTVSYNLEVQVKANGAPQVSTVGVASCAVMNVALDALFVMGFGWGVWGAALATVMAQGVSVILSLLIIRGRQLPFAFSRANIRFRKNLIRKILVLGFPIALQDFLVSVSFLAIAAIVKAEGLEASDEDVEAEYNKMAAQYGMDVENVKKYLDDAVIKEQIVRAKAVELVAAAAVPVKPEEVKAEEPKAEEPAEEPKTEKPKRTRKKKAEPKPEEGSAAEDAQ